MTNHVHDPALAYTKEWLPSKTVSSTLKVGDDFEARVYPYPAGSNLWAYSVSYKGTPHRLQTGYSRRADAQAKARDALSSLLATYLTNRKPTNPDKETSTMATRERIIDRERAGVLLDSAYYGTPMYMPNGEERRIMVSFVTIHPNAPDLVKVSAAVKEATFTPPLKWGVTQAEALDLAKHGRRVFVQGEPGGDRIAAGVVFFDGVPHLLTSGGTKIGLHLVRPAS